MESSAFLMSRVMVFSLLLLFFVIAERVFLNRDLKVLDVRLSKMVKSPILELPIKETRYLRRQPERLLRVLKKKDNQVRQEVSSIMAASTVNALAPLVELSELIGRNDKVNLVNLNVDGTKARAVFGSKDPKEMEKFSEHLKTLGLDNQKVGFTKGQVKAVLDFEY